MLLVDQCREIVANNTVSAVQKMCVERNMAVKRNEDKG